MLVHPFRQPAVQTSGHDLRHDRQELLDVLKRFQRDGQAPDRRHVHIHQLQVQNPVLVPQQPAVGIQLQGVRRVGLFRQVLRRLVVQQQRLLRVDQIGLARYQQPIRQRPTVSDCY